MTKVCACGCGQEFKADKWHPNQRYYSGQCRSRAHYRDHRQGYQAQSKLYYKDHREEDLARSRHYREEHKDALKAYNRAYYREHREEIKAYNKHYQKEHKDQIKARNEQRRGEGRAYIKGILAKSSCQRCGFNDSRALIFHHRNPAHKDWNVTKLTMHGPTRIDREVAKCDVLCANCHMIIHWEMSNGQE